MEAQARTAKTNYECVPFAALLPFGDTPETLGALAHFVHPAMRQLMAYDRQMAYTLYVYLLNERNVRLAAEALYMHGNTLRYRVQRIEKLVSIDLENPYERRRLLLSYELLCGGDARMT